MPSPAAIHFELLLSIKTSLLPTINCTQNAKILIAG
jgi:hypothetical protein